MSNLQPLLRFKEFSSEWNFESFDCFAQVLKAKFNPAKDKTVKKCIELEHLSQATGEILAYIDSSNQKSIKNSFKKGDLLFGKLRPNLKKYAIAPFDGVCSSEILVISSNKIDNKFLFTLFFTERFYRASTISSGSKMPRADMGFINAYPFAYPKEKREQQRIAEFIALIDTKITQLKEKKHLLEQYKKGVLQKLFSQDVRFKDEEGIDFPKWKEIDFKSFITARSEYPDSTNCAPLASLTIKNGIEAKSARYVRDFLVTDDKSAYKLVGPRDFVANPMNLRFGAIAKNHSNTEVKISKYYDVFQCDNSICPDFFELFLLSLEMRKEYCRTATGTLEEKKRVHYSEFINFNKKLPSKKEQIKIASFDKSLKNRIAFIKKQIEHTQTFKKGLLQQMFV
jgi:type I restriction enzyme S subunit